MRRAPLRILAVFAAYICIFALARILFLCAHAAEGWGASQWFSAIYHGLSMDMTMAGYLTVIPALMLAASPWCHAAMRLALKIYFGVMAVVIAAIVVLDIALYGYWGFRLDTTPFFYLLSSPEAAMASSPWWQIAGGVAAILLIAYGIYKFCCLTLVADCARAERPVRTCAISLVFAALLFFPIRGGVTVSTMNLSRAYFSSDRRLNHAAVNPAFSLLYSLTHGDDFGGQYRFMDASEAEGAMARLNSACTPDSGAIIDAPVLNTARPDIYLIILESFSAHLLPSMGGEAIAVKLDSIASTGLLFTNFYASSFRTDRALPAILNAFPAQPSTSLMKHVSKAEKLPSLAAALNAAGYESEYYYGGDINFTNMNALLVNGGFGTIVSDADFPVQQKTGKWGAPDGPLVERMLAAVEATPEDAAPRFRVLQTSSSHEPFHVPYINARFAQDAPKNAFAYTDSCLGALVRGVEASARGHRALFVIVPDHLGAWPLGLTEHTARHHVPLVIAGPALECAPARPDVVGGQTDIAPTILAMLGLDGSAFPWGHNLLDASAPHHAFFSEPGLAALVTEGDTAVIDCDANTVLTPTARPATLEALRAYLQTLYQTIDKL